MTNPELGNLLEKLRRYERKPSNIVNPFTPLEGISWLNKRILEGSCGPLASLDRSTSIEIRSQQLISQIKKERSKWQQKITTDKPRAEREKDQRLEELKHNWQEISNGKPSEKEQWLAEALGLTTAYFEVYTQKKIDNFSFWDNQLLYMTLMTLDQGQYSFGELTSKHRGVQLDTGEGKTKCSGVIAALEILQGKPVVVVEQNYVSAKTHADETAPFFERFLHQDTGVIVDLSEKDKEIFETKVDHKTGLITRSRQSGEQNRQAFIYTDGRLHDQKGKAGRKRAWEKQVVYVDFNSLGIDAVEDRQITTNKNNRIQPSLSERVGLIQEADRLMVDEAINPYEIETVAKGLRGWDIIAESIDFGEGKKRKPKTIKKLSQRRELLINYFYSLWGNLEALNAYNPNLINLWKKSLSFFVEPGNEVQLLDELIQTTENNIVEWMAFVFDEQNDKTKKFKKTREFLVNNRHITQTAIETIFGVKPQEGYLPGKEPILMDQYGIPLDRRHLSAMSHVFLQLSNIWQKEGFNTRDVSPEEFEKIKRRTWSKIEVPDQIISRVIPSVLFREFGELRVTSGSLIPVSQTMADIYEAETVVVSRHQPIKNPEQLDPNKLYALCADQGLTEVNFVPDAAFFSELSKQARKISSLGQASLIILPDVASASKFAEYLRTNHTVEKIQARLIKVITGKEEYQERGTLEKIVASIETGDIIITTQIAHRDIDPRLSKDVKLNGGLVTIVHDPPNERGLWQALQRSIRADVPGRRILYITKNSVNLARNLYLVDDTPLPPISSLITSKKQLHVDRIARVDNLWTQAVSGNLKSQEELFGLYLNMFRYTEGVQSDGILFQTARERHMDKFRRTALNYLEKGKRKITLQTYIDYLAYKYFKTGNHSFPPTNPQAFLSATSEEKRIELLRSLGVYGQTDYIHFQQQVRNIVLSEFWSDLLYELDYLYRDFTQQLPIRPVHSITEYENFWLTHIENHLQNIDLKKYIRKKFGLTLPK